MDNAMLVKQTDKHSEHKAQVLHHTTKSLHWHPLQWAGNQAVPHSLLCAYIRGRASSTTAVPLCSVSVFTINAFISV